jgi:DivIVA domain-containing protein
MRKRDEASGQGFEPQAAPPASVITPQTIQDKEFPVSRFGGYRMRDVDEFLDVLTTSMQRLEAENERLRAAGGGARVSDGPAERTLEQAREEAARIVAEAQERAAAISGARAMTGSPATAQERAAVQSFLNRERDFLQSLASLVQEHVDSVKGMAREARQPSGPPRAAEATPSSAAPESTAPGPEAASTSATGRGAEDPAQARPRVDEPIRVDEPEPAGVSNAESSEPEGSLRELFWGEDG